MRAPPLVLASMIAALGVGTGCPKDSIGPARAPLDDDDEDTGNGPGDDGDDPGDHGDDPPDTCTDTPNKSARVAPFVYYGTTRPSHVPLSDGQIQAIGTFHPCSGTFITDEWVLTANHCGLSTSDEFCIGVQAGNPNVCFPLAEVHSHPQGDMTLVRVSGSAAARLAGTQPIPIVMESLEGMEGQTAEAAGYGQQEDGGYGEREFTAEPIDDVSGDNLTINGEGQHGVCFGDSGGPVMIIAADGSARVAGALSNGDGNCVGYDRFTRVDTYRDWILSYIGEVPVVDPPEPECGGVATAFGRCDGDRLVWCANGDVVERPCGSCGGDTCGLLDASSGYACLDASCASLPTGGSCAGSVLTTCASGSRTTRDCSSAGDICDLDGSGAAACLAPTECGSLDYLGRCDGESAVWCNQNGQRETLDCAARGESCEYIDDQYGYYCR